MTQVIRDSSHHQTTCESDSLFKNLCNELRVKSHDSWLVHPLMLERIMWLVWGVTWLVRDLGRGRGAECERVRLYVHGPSAWSGVAVKEGDHIRVKRGKWAKKGQKEAWHFFAPITYQASFCPTSSAVSKIGQKEAWAKKSVSTERPIVILLKSLLISYWKPYSCTPFLQKCVDEFVECPDWSSEYGCIDNKYEFSLYCRKTCGNCGFLSRKLLAKCTLKKTFQKCFLTCITIFFQLS